MSSSDGELSEESSKNVKIRSYVKVKDHNEDKDYSRRSRDEFYSDRRRRRSRNHGYSRNRSPDEGCEKRGHYEYSDNDDDNSDVKFLSRKRKNDNHSDADERRKNETKADSYENRNTQNKRVMRMENDYQQELHAYKCDKNKKSNGDLHSDIDREKTLSGDGGGSKEEKKKKTIDDIFTRTGGAYIPPSKLRELQEGITDKSSAAYQRMSWEALKKSINGLVNKVNISNISFIVQEMMSENIVRGRGLAAMSIIRAQVASPTFSHVYAALVAIINTKFPNIGELLLRRLIIQFRKSFKRNDKAVCMNSLKFIAHLINQQVAHEILALEVLTLLLQEPSGDSVEVAISFLKEIGSKLNDVSPKGMEAVFEKLRNILHHSETERRVQYMIEVIFAMRRENFQQFPSMIQELDLVEEDDQITHLLRIDDAGDGENILNVFKYDPNFVENEEKYNQIKKDILGESSDSSGDEDEDDDDEEDNDEEDKDPTMQIIDRTETNLVALRRQIYLTIQSSLDFEECAHKMMKINLKEGQQHEFCLMVVECCAQQRSYEKFYGLLGQRFCLLRKEFMQQYVIIFQEQYENCHHLETNKLRNTAKFFSHLLHSDAVTWTVLDVIRLNEDDTTSSSRIFIKILFQELAEYLGIQKLVKRLKDPVIALCLEGIFPRDNPRNTRFAINFFTAIGLGVLTEELREHLKTMPKVSSIAQQIAAAGLNESSSSDSSSDSDSSNSSDSSSTDSSESDSEREQKKTTKSHRSSSDESKHETKKYVSQSNHSRDKSNSHKRHENRSYSKDNKFSREMDERANHSRRR